MYKKWFCCCICWFLIGCNDTEIKDFSGAYKDKGQKTNLQSTSSLQLADRILIQKMDVGQGTYQVFIFIEGKKYIAYQHQNQLCIADDKCMKFSNDSFEYLKKNYVKEK